VPPLPPVADVFRWEMLGTYEDAHWANVFHVGYSFTGVPTQTDIDNVNEALKDVFDTNITALMTAACASTQSILTDLTSSTGLRSEVTETVAGSVTTGNQLPASMAIGVSWPIARRYRGGHPRSYFVASTDTYARAASSKLISTGGIASWEAGALGLFSGVPGAVSGAYLSLALGAVSYRTANAPRVTPLWEPFTGTGVVHPRFDTQRRRLGKETT
jgi:hypothetical protein